MRKTTFYLLGTALAGLLIGGSAMQIKAGQEEDWHFRFHSGDHIPRHAPAVVAEREFKGQATSIPETTLFTPACNCMFRVSVYLDQPYVIPGLGGYTPITYLSWSDDFARNQAQILGFEVVKDAMPAYGTYQITVYSAAKQPIQFSTYENPNEGGTYNVHVVVEEL